MPQSRLTRREAIGSLTALAAAGPAVLAIKPKPNPYEECAKDAAKWIRAQAVETEHGLAWPAIPGKKETISPDLYSGSAGVVLLLAEAGKRWSDRSLQIEAQRGIQELLSVGRDHTDRGFYTGLAGIGWSAARSDELNSGRSGNAGAALLYSAMFRRDQEGNLWTSKSNDLISGVAGVSLAYFEGGRLFERRSLERENYGIELLLKRAIPVGGAYRWALEEGYDRDLPNFSHGTAGVAFCLAKLFGKKKDYRYLVSAEKGAQYLLSIANLEKNGCLIYHADPDGKNRYYLGWCHGPAGTSQLWWQLAKATGDKKWEEYAHRGAQSLLDLGVPERRTEGYWNNDGLCCGTAGIGRFFLDMFRRSGQRRYWDAAERCAQVILKNAVRDEQGARWVFAEHRVRPQEVFAQTGWMQGAAGIAAFLIEMTSPKKVVFRLPVDAD